MPPLDYEAAKTLLEETFVLAEEDFATGITHDCDAAFIVACDGVFVSQTQAHREALLGCLLARMQDNTTDVRSPYVNQGARAFNGRELDQRVINPFLRGRHVPSTVGPYLSAFRRSVHFDQATRQGVRDKVSYDHLLNALERLEATDSYEDLAQMLRFLLYKFVELREAAHIVLTTLQRMSLEQYDTLITGLLATPSQGRFPVILLVATFRAINGYFGKDWVIEMQGINEADRPGGAGGDITIRSDGQTVLVAEVTERPVDLHRVVQTFQTKIAPQGIEEYLFFVRPQAATQEARQQAHQYFAQGHAVNFLEIKVWMLMALATIGSRGRQLFTQSALDLLGADDLPRTVKVAWNTQMERLVAPP
ncbi:MAG: hypothetical protein ABID84_03830 [Chloroflexota bacterium]